MRETYKETHPWLRFFLDLNKVPHSVWMNLGAIQSKCEHVANAMLPPAIAKDLWVLYLAKGISATTAIEGNTLTEDEVRQLIAKKSRVLPSKEYQAQEVRNILGACNQISVEILKGTNCALTVQRIKELNRLILKDLPLDEGVVPGEISKHNVVVASYRGAPREECELLLSRMCSWLEEIRPISDSDRIAMATLKAVMAHLYLAWIHPFGDGNGRTARLVELHILIEAGVPAIAAHLLSNHYNQTRPEYYRQLDRASKSGGDVWPFVHYAVQGLVDGLTNQIAVIRKHQWDIAWKDYVYEAFRDKTTEAAHRQRLLALRLPKVKWMSLIKVPVLSPELAKAYANRTTKTIVRDVNALVRMKLVVRDRSRRIRANRKLLQYFLPPRRNAQAATFE